MGDILTQIQDELDMLLNQMQSQLSYIKNRAPPALIPGQPLLTTFAEQEAQAAAQSNTNQPQPTQPIAPPTQEEFQKDIRELSRDLLLKEQQVEVLIASLPGLNTSEEEQMARMRELEKELEGLERERVEAVKEKERLVREVEGRIRSVGLGKTR